MILDYVFFDLSKVKGRNVKYPKTFDSLTFDSLLNFKCHRSPEAGRSTGLSHIEILR